MTCEWCGGEVGEDAGPCPRSFACPTCRQGPGSPCKRPSGHTCVMHAPRIALAEGERPVRQQPAGATVAPVLGLF